MIITLKGADFSASNIGTLSTWRITRSLGTGADYIGVTSVDKGAAFNATVTIAEGYELGASGVTVTMGGQILSSGVTINGSTITISIASVTGNVTIKVPTVNLSTGEEDVGGNTGSDSGDVGGDLGDPSITYLLNLNFNTTPVANMSDVIVVDLPDSTIPLQQTSEGIVNNGANPYGFALVNPIKIPDNWCFEYCAKMPIHDDNDTSVGGSAANPGSYGILGGANTVSASACGPCILGDSTAVQIRYTTGDPRTASDYELTLLDNQFHTYKFVGKPDRSVDFYRDGTFMYNKAITKGSVSSTGSWGRVLGLHKEYADAMNAGAYKTDKGGIIKHVRLWEGTN